MRHLAPRGGLTPYTLAMNYLPLAYLATGAGAVWWAEGMAARWAIAVGWVYLVPPFICRLTLAVFGSPCGRALRQERRDYKVWWFLLQLQAVFNRLPWLEELLRLVPGAYAAWLRLWGSQVSPFAYWGPGSRVLDRYLLRIERSVVVGAQVAMTGHVATIADDGAFVVDVDAVTVGRGAILGARCGLGPGCRVAPRELVTAGRLLQPYTTWEGGRKNKKRTAEP